MNAERLLQHYEKIADAPDAIARLRRFILDLAVRGKLVPQDLKEEPASELLQRIAKERTRLVKAGEIKNKLALPSVDGPERPFDIPASWEWVRFANVVDFSAGRTPSRNDLSFWNNGDHSWVSIADMQDGQILTATKESVSDKARARIFGSAPEAPGTILMSFKLTIGKIARLGVPAFHNEAIISIRPHVSELDPYLFKVLPQFARQGDTKGAIKGATLNRDSISNILIPLPPLAEQNRIVAKVDELMGHCDRLEAAREKREATRDRLAAASLARLDAPDPETFQTDARFALDTLPALTTRPDQIKRLRQTILNLAVRGKLVPQDANDEPASELLKKIANEKAKLVKAGQLKKDKAFWDGLPSGPPFATPLNWCWARLQDVFEISRGGSPRPAGDPRFFGGKTPWITVQEITKDGDKYLSETSSGLTDEGVRRSRLIAPGDLLLTNSGATLGVPKISKIKACMNDGVAVLRQFHSISLNDFCYIYLQSQTLAFRAVNQGMGQPNLNTPIIAGWFVPLPPLAEQRRIVAKVDALMALCNRLEASLTAAAATRRRLLDALLTEALTPDAIHDLEAAQ